MLKNKFVNELLSFSEDTLILDTETTGLDHCAEVIEIAVIDMQGNVLLNTFVKPTKPIDEKSIAFKVNKITNKDVEHAPSWKDVQEQLLTLTSGKKILIYNSKFDTKIMNQSAYYNQYYEVEYANVHCLMKLYSKWYAKFHNGDSKQYHKLTDAAQFCGIEITNTHRALDDCLISLGLLKHMQASCKVLENYTEHTKRTKTTANPNGHLFGETVVITGDLSMPRAELQKLAADAGCRCTSSVSVKTTILVLGETNLIATKGKISQKEHDARELQAQGYPIRILNEEEFIALLK